jgi:hypothetical protein
MPSRRQSSEMFSSPRNPSSTMRIFSFCRVLPARLTPKGPSALVLPEFYPARISVSSWLLAATMNQKSSVRKVPEFVSGVLTGNMLASTAALLTSGVTAARARTFSGALPWEGKRHAPNPGTTHLINRKNGMLQALGNHATACLLTPRYVALRNRAMALS